MNGNYIAAATLALIALSKRQGSMGRRGRKRREWTEEQIGLLGTATDAEVATALGVSLSSVSAKRRELGIEPYGWKTKPSSDLGDNIGSEEPTTERRGHGQLLHREWVEDQIDLLGNFPDWEIARLLDTHEYYVAEKRRELGIDSFPIEEWNFRKENYNWTPEKIALLGTMTDRDLSALWGDIHYSTIARKRNALGIDSFGTSHTRYEDVDVSVIDPNMFGIKTDREIHTETGVPLFAVKRYREDLGIEDYRILRAKYIEEALDSLSRYLGKLPDDFLAEKYNVPILLVQKKRRDMGIRPGNSSVYLYLPKYMIDTLTVEVLNCLGNMSDTLIEYKYNYPKYNLAAVRKELGIPEYKKVIDRNKNLGDGWSPEDILLFMTKPDDWNSEAFAIPMWAVKALRMYWLDQMQCYPQGLTEESKNMIMNKLYQQMVSHR